MIDLGTQPVGRTLSFVELDFDRIDYLVEMLNIVEMPVVLDVFPRHDSPDARALAVKRGEAGLIADDVFADGRVHPDIEAWLRILERPTWYVSARLVPRPYSDSSAVLRVCLAANDSGTVVAVRTDDVLVIRAAAKDGATELLDLLGSAEGFSPPEFRGISAPTDVLSEALDASPTDAAATARRLTHIGVASDSARELAWAMSTCSSHAEITSVTVGEGTRSPGAHPVAFFDTHRGRVVATSSTATDGRRWSSLASGSDAKVTSALTELIDRAQRSTHPRSTPPRSTP